MPNKQVAGGGSVLSWERIAERDKHVHKHTWCPKKWKEKVSTLLPLLRYEKVVLNLKTQHSPLISYFWLTACCRGRAEAARKLLSPLNISTISSGKVAVISRRQRRKGKARWLSTATAVPTGLYSRMLIKLVTHLQICYHAGLFKRKMRIAQCTAWTSIKLILLFVRYSLHICFVNHLCCVLLWVKGDILMKVFCNISTEYSFCTCLCRCIHCGWK